MLVDDKMRCKQHEEAELVALAMVALLRNIKSQTAHSGAWNKHADGTGVDLVPRKQTQNLLSNGLVTSSSLFSTFFAPITDKLLQGRLDLVHVKIGSRL